MRAEESEEKRVEEITLRCSECGTIQSEIDVTIYKEGNVMISNPSRGDSIYLYAKELDQLLDLLAVSTNAKSIVTLQKEKV